MARTAYAGSANPIRTSRGTEYEAFARITARLRAALAGGRGGFAALAAALHDNRQLWTLLAADVAEKENGLAEDLRARIFYLAEFTRQHTTKVLAGRARAEVLVEINAAVMSGLRAERSAA
jgi:flagellar protein FlaF